MENLSSDQQISFQKEDKDYEEMINCKASNSNCCAIEYTAFLTGGQLGSIGAGQYKAPGLKCEYCRSKAYCSDELTLHIPGWY